MVLFKGKEWLAPFTQQHVFQEPGCGSVRVRRWALWASHSHLHPGGDGSMPQASGWFSLHSATKKGGKSSSVSAHLSEWKQVLWYSRNSCAQVPWNRLWHACLTCMSQKEPKWHSKLWEWLRYFPPVLNSAHFLCFQDTGFTKPRVQNEKNAVTI